jgi:copper chaperone CopZ
MELLYSLSFIDVSVSSTALSRLARYPHSARLILCKMLAPLGISLILSLAIISTGMAQNVADTRRERQALITVKGVANPFTSFGIVKRLRQVPGVKDVTFDLYSGQAIVTIDKDADVSEVQLREAVRNASYTAGKIQWRDVPARQPGAMGR